MNKTQIKNFCTAAEHFNLVAYGLTFNKTILNNFNVNSNNIVLIYRNNTNANNVSRDVQKMYIIIK